jgi:hypothetical protein
MTPLALAKRLEALEVEVSKIAPPAPPPEWLAWATDDELKALMLLFDREG